MKFQVHSLKFDADIKLLAFIGRKLNKLDTFYDRIVDGEVFLKINNEGNHSKTVEVKLNLPKNQVFVKEHSNSFEEATDKAMEALQKQLKRFKEKQKAH